MRLKDADKILEAIANSGLVWETNECLDVIEVLVVKKIIDDAPTVEERPQGEWIEKVERRGCFVGDKTVYSYTCPFCGVKEFKKYPFCHCGADMRGENT
jgi:hypothetical protein